MTGETEITETVSDDHEVFRMPLSWALKATSVEIANSHVRMAAVSAGDGDPGWEGQKLDDATRFYGPSIIAHTLLILKRQGMSQRRVMQLVRRELGELLDVER